MPDHFKTQRMCERAFEESPHSLEFVPDHLKKKICERAVEKHPYNLKIVPDHLKTQEMCDKAVHIKLYTLRHVVDWFVTQEEIDLWDDDISGTKVIKNARTRKQK